MKVGTIDLASSPTRATAIWRGGLAKLPWLLIPYDSLTHLLSLDPSATSQTLPATAVFSVLYVALRGMNLRSSVSSRRVAWLLITAVTLMLMITLSNAVVEYAVGVQADWVTRVPTASRQALSMLLGISTLLMFQDAVLHLGLAMCMRWIVVGAIPSLLLALSQLPTGADRVQGFSSEPSHLADMLVFAFLPACVIAAMRSKYRIVGAFCGVLALVGTLSSTGFIKALFALMGYFAARGRLFRGLLLAGALMLLVYFALSFFPDNYVFLILSYMQFAYEETGELVTGSFIDRFFGLMGPLSLLADPHAWFGFGFGGDTVYFDRLFSPEIASAIREVKSDTVSISSLQGKMLMYGGLTGYATYLAAWLAAWRCCPRGHLARVMLPAVWLASLFSLGPLFLPYTWLWLAIASASPIDSNSLQGSRR